MNSNNIYEAPESLFTPVEPERWSGRKLLFMTVIPSLIYFGYYLFTDEINLSTEFMLILIPAILVCACWTGFKMAHLGGGGVVDYCANSVSWLLIHCGILFFLSVILAVTADLQRVL